MRLILTRHGETVENEKGIMQGHTPGTLTEEGVRQAELLAKRLAGEKIDAIFSSDLARAVHTARIIAEEHPKARLHFTKELRERDLGSYTGKRKDEVDWHNTPPDVETLEGMTARIRAFLDSVYAKHKNKCVVFVGHGGINKVLILAVMKKPLSEFFSLDSQLNTAVNLFDISEDSNHRVHLLNCVRHLR